MDFFVLFTFCLSWLIKPTQLATLWKHTQTSIIILSTLQSCYSSFQSPVQHSELGDKLKEVGRGPQFPFYWLEDMSFLSIRLLRKTVFLIKIRDRRRLCSTGSTWRHCPGKPSVSPKRRAPHVRLWGPSSGGLWCLWSLFWPLPLDIFIHLLRLLDKVLRY